MKLSRRQRRALRGELNRVTGDRWTADRVAALSPAEQVRLHRTFVAPRGRRAQDLRGALQLRLRAHGGGDLLPDAVIVASNDAPDEGLVSVKLGATTHLNHHHILRRAAPHDLATATTRALGLDEALAAFVRVDGEDVDLDDEDGYSVTWWAIIPRWALAAPGRRGRADLVPGMIRGDTRAMKLLEEQVRRVAPYPVSVVIRGETGTGKELVARSIHRASRRRGAFVAVNCAALTPTIINSTLFGHVRGAFTGADRKRDGAFVTADKGTLFLDEVGELTPEAQALLLRTLQEGQVRPVGSDRPVPVNVRIVCASHTNLERDVAAGSFREDLFYRLQGVLLRVPPLRDRRSDIPALSAGIVRSLSQEMGFRDPQIEPAALDALARYEWPGNIRQLRNVLLRAILLSPGGGKTRQITSTDVRRALPRTPARRPAVRETRAPAPELVVSMDEPTSDLSLIKEDRQRRALVQALILHDGNKAAAAESLGISRSTLYDRIRRFGLS